MPFPKEIFFIWDSILFSSRNYTTSKETNGPISGKQVVLTCPASVMDYQYFFDHFNNNMFLFLANNIC